MDRAQGGAVEQVERARMSAEEVSWALRALLREADEVTRLLGRRLRLRPLDHQAMTHVMNEPGGLGPADLSERLGISTGSATELVDRLEGAGHVRRERDARDRRRVALAPTESTVSSTLAALGPLFADLDALVSEFSAQEQATVVRYLRAAADRMRAHAERLTQP
ncbi:MarR family transcriptional regulator [Quadrisphaera sp. KR29]|uniref:MarR family transcriptional regulator n=1 Tax=Quadrisphaera sp. KR29 TaxID=3461391 RepID=UPI0040449F87